MKLLCLGTYPIESAAARYRVLQFFPQLRAAGIDPTFRPFMDSRFFKRFYEPQHKLQKATRLLGFALKRCADVQRAKDYDVILIHRETALFGPPVVEKLIAQHIGKPVVFDFDDAIHVSYISPTYGKLASLIKYPQKTPQIIALSRAVIAGNHHLESYAQTINPHVTLIPTVVDANIVRPAKKDQQEPLVLGWIGTHSTFPYLETLFPVLKNLAQRHKFVLRIIGAGQEVQLDGVMVDNRRWNLKRETRDLQSFDIGLYPIPEDEWSIGKSGFKAVQYMAVGIPAVCSPVGATCDIVEDGVNGFLPRTDEEWEARLVQLLEEASLREQLGRAGRARVENWYCLERQAPRLCQVIRTAAT